MRRPPLVLIVLSVLLLALGTTGGAVMSLLQPQIQRFSTERIFSAREVHNLSGSREYDAEVVADIVFTIEAGLSFFHTHGEGMGVVLLFAATAVASLVGRRWLRALLYWLLGLSFLFPLGYVGYSALILFYGKDAGIALAEQALLIPFGSSAILGLSLLVVAAGFLLANGRLRRALTAPRDAGVVPKPAPEDSAGWRRPPRPVVLAAALLIALAEIGGASMARFKPELTAFATARILERPQVHGLVGSRDVDNEILDEALVKLDGALRLFHLHGEGMGLVIFGVALVISTLVRTTRIRKTLHVLLTLGGFGFPFGYLLWSVLIPFVGVGPARTIAAILVLIPSGGLVVIALWALTVYLVRDLPPKRWRRLGQADEAPGRGAVGLPPFAVILASMLLLVLAEVGGGAMVKFKVALERANRERVEARPQIHGLVGVREVDGPVIDNLVARADFALRLFHLHGEGMGLVIFAGGLMIRNFLTSRALSRALYAMLVVGGFLYPFGYLAWSGMIPVLGLERSKDLAEYLAWIPFGGAALVAMAVISLMLGRGIYVAWRERRGNA
ncbi:MAG: hypothetical protein HY726_00915 [Candidatus Rokubacteria bacterium]|nr:hypothetical protein [Candidatus Rokubacteria bacterium]